MFCRRQRFDALTGKAQRFQPGADFFGAEGFALPQKRLPQTGQQTFLGPLLQQEALFGIFGQHYRHRLDAPCFGRSLMGQFQRRAGPAGFAQRRQRTLLTERCAVRHTDQCAQLHQSLVVVARLLGGLMLHDPGRKSSFYRRFCNNARVIIQSGKHPQHISVHRRDSQPEADGRDGSRCVVPGTGQSAEGVVVGWQLPAVLLTDDAGRLLQVAYPAVVAQPLPELVELFFFARRQRWNVRQGGEEALIIGQRRRDAGLLQHDLAEPDVVGAGVGAERQDALVLVEPFQQCRGDVFHLFCSPC